MATNPSTLPENATRITAPDADYTYGSAKDDTTGTAGDGTPIKKALLNDSYGFFQACLVAAGITPSGNAETVPESQILQALQGVVGSFSDKSQWPTVANGTDADHDIDFSAGKMPDSTGTRPVILPGTMTKQIDAPWVAGTGAGGLFSGTVAVDTTYHCFLIVRDADGVVDAGFDTSLTAANIPAGYTAYRRVASVYTDASANLVQFYQVGDYFGLDASVKDLDVTAHAASGTPATLSLPTGLENLTARLEGSLYIGTGGAGVVVVGVTSLRTPDIIPSTVTTSFWADPSSGPLAAQTFEVDVSSAATVRYRNGIFAGGSGYQFLLYTRGWIDPRID